MTIHTVHHSFFQFGQILRRHLRIGQMIFGLFSLHALMFHPIHRLAFLVSHVSDLVHWIHVPPMNATTLAALIMISSSLKQQGRGKWTVFLVVTVFLNDADGSLVKLLGPVTLLTGFARGTQIAYWRMNRPLISIEGHRKYLSHP